MPKDKLKLLKSNGLKRRHVLQQRRSALKKRLLQPLSKLPRKPKEYVVRQKLLQC